MILDQLRQLQNRGSLFFDQFANKYSNDLACLNDCHRCCYTSISVFQWEAELIFDWFQSLAEDEKEKLKILWKSVTQESGLDQFGKNQKPCVFLKNNKCSIYNARPGICRTQGLSFIIDGQKENCPLNFQNTTTGPSHNDYFNLQTWNEIVTNAQNIFKTEFKSPKLGNISNQNERVKLSDLYDKISK